MSKVLFLAYHFPPLGGAGVQRNSKFARYLPEFGHSLTVITGPGDGEDRWTPVDETLTGDVPAGTEVHRLPGPDPRRSGGWRGRGERWLGLDTPWLRWWREHVIELGCDVGQSADLVYASLVPYESAGPAIELAARLAKPLVVDLQDPWALDEMMVYPTSLHRRRGIAQMRRALAAADAVVMNTPESRLRVLERFPELRAKPVVAIPNGFDGVDFGGPPPVRSDSSFRVVHTGYLHTELGLDNRRGGIVRRVLGGGSADVDILTRSHVFLVEAIEQLRAEEPEVGSKIELHLVGVLTEADRRVGERSPAVRMLGYLPHDETVSLMRSADLLFLPMHDVPAGTRVGIVPGKTYEYLASETPILAAVPEGDIAEILTEGGNAFVCAPPDVDAMKNVLRTQVRRLLAGDRPRGRNPAVLARFERRHLSENLSELFEIVLGEQGADVDEPILAARGGR